MLAAFEQHRPLLFAIAYRMLGTVSDAEDIVQETYLRVEQHVQQAAQQAAQQASEKAAQQHPQAAPSAIQSPKAYLTTIATRLCLDRLKSAQAQRETYIGPWLPEPILTSPEDNAESSPEARAELKDSISLAFLALLERLNPVERAVFLLRQVFDYDYREIAPIVDKSESACRQIFHRAQAFIRANRPRLPVTKEAHTQLLQSFLTAMLSGDLNGLTSLLHEDATSYGDGGGKAYAARVPLVGRDKVARLCAGLHKLVPADTAMEIREINGWPSLIIRNDGVVTGVFTIDTDGERILAVRSVVNPDKLRHLN